MNRTNMLLGFAGLGAVCLLAPAAGLRAQSEPADAVSITQLNAMVQGLGFETKAIVLEPGEEKYEFIVATEEYDVPMAFEISASGRYIWLTVNLGPTPNDASPKMAEMLRRNFIIQPSHFYVTRSGRLMMGIAMDNRGLTPAALRRTVEKISGDVEASADIWDSLP